MLCHGGPIAEPADAEYVLRRADGIHGFYGASSMERLPVEQALKAQTEAFKAVTFTVRPHIGEPSQQKTVARTHQSWREDTWPTSTSAA